MAETNLSLADKSGQVGGSETHTAAGVTDKVSALSAKAKETVSATIEKTKDVASSLVQKVEEVASTIGHKAEGARETVAGEMKSLAGTIRTKAPQAGVLATAASEAASTLEAGGNYLQEHNFSGVARDLTDLIRRHPLQAILLGIGVGFLVGRVSRR
jgi:ElaB/YqjD/DUF883 family membrane-anchored ribosome-binding protein